MSEKKKDYAPTSALNKSSLDFWCRPSNQKKVLQKRNIFRDSSNFSKMEFAIYQRNMSCAKFLCQFWEYLYICNLEKLTGATGKHLAEDVYLNKT